MSLLEQYHFLTVVVVEFWKSNEISGDCNVRARSYRRDKCSDFVLGYGYHLANVETQNETSILQTAMHKKLQFGIH